MEETKLCGKCNKPNLFGELPESIGRECYCLCDELQEQPLNTHDLLEKEKNKASHLQPWQFKKGQSGNPNGRPAGKSLKERAKAMLNAMTEEEEQEFFAGIDKKTIWEMAEGKAEAKTDITSKGEAIPVLVKFIDGKGNDN